MPGSIRIPGKVGGTGARAGNLLRLATLARTLNFSLPHRSVPHLDIQPLPTLSLLSSLTEPEAWTREQGGTDSKAEGLGRKDTR